MFTFRNIVWYMGVLIVSLTLILSFITKNWLLSGICAFVTAVLKANCKDIAIPKFYTDKGVTNEYFSNGGKYEKNNK